MTDDTYHIRARDTINAARRGQLPKPKSGPTNSTPTNSIEVYNDEFGRNTLLTRSARVRKFKFYQYKPVNDSPSTPVLIPREDVVQGRVGLEVEQSKELVEIDEQIMNIEKNIESLRDDNRFDEIIDLVHKKNDLLRRQMQLNIIEQEKALEKANDELTKELRSLLEIEESKKSKAQLDRQRYLYDQLLILVNKRNELVHHMDVQEKGIEDDHAMKAKLKTILSGSSKGSQDNQCIIQ